MPLIIIPDKVARLSAVLSEFISPVFKSSFSMSTYKTIFEENYEVNVRFNELTHFKAEENFYSALPFLLKSKRL